MNSFLLPAATLWQRELVRFWRQKSRVMGVVASPLVFWLLIGYGSNDLARFYSGALVLTVMFSAIFFTISISPPPRSRRKSSGAHWVPGASRPSASARSSARGSSP